MNAKDHFALAIVCYIFLNAMLCCCCCFRQAPKKPEVATVISAFTASDAKEISLNPGQLVHVLKKDPAGWWQGELQVIPGYYLPIYIYQWRLACKI